MGIISKAKWESFRPTPLTARWDWLVLRDLGIETRALNRKVFPPHRISYSKVNMYLHNINVNNDMTFQLKNIFLNLPIFCKMPK